MQKFNLPASIKSNIPSWITSVYTDKSFKSESTKPLITAFATLPTPDCNGKRF